MADDLHLAMGITAEDNASAVIKQVQTSLNELAKQAASFSKRMKRSLGEDLSRAFQAAATASTKFSTDTTVAMTKASAAIRADVQAMNDLAGAYRAAAGAQRDFNRGSRGRGGGGGGRPPSPPNAGPDLREIRRRWSMRERSARAEVTEINRIARAEAQRQRSVLDGVARTWKLRQASEKDHLRHLSAAKRERDSMRREMSKRTREVYHQGRHALRSLDHPVFESPGFWLSAGAVFGAEAGKHLLEAARNIDTATTRYSMMPGVSAADAARTRGDALREGMRIGVDPSEIVRLQTVAIKDGLSADIAKSLPSIVNAAAQVMGGSVERDGDELARGVREAQTVGWVKDAAGARSFMNSVAGLSNFGGNSPEKMRQFLENGGIGRGKELGWSQDQTLAFGAALNGSGERSGLGSARLMAQLPEIRAQMRDRFLHASRSRENTEENRAVRSAPSKLGYSNIREMQNAFASPEGVTDFLSRLSQLPEQLRASIEKGYGLGPQFNAVAAEMGADHGHRYHAALEREKQLSSQTADNDDLSKNQSKWSGSIEFMVGQLKASVSAVQSELGDVIKDDILAPFTKWWVNISEALLDGSMKQDLHLAIRSFLQGLGFNDLTAALNALRSSIGTFNLGEFLGGVGEGLRTVVDGFSRIAHVLGFMGDGSARTLGKLAVELLGLSVALRVVAPLVTLLGGVAAGFRAIAAAAGAIRLLSGLAGAAGAAEGVAGAVGGAALTGALLPISIAAIAVGTIAVAIMNWDSVTSAWNDSIEHLKGLITGKPVERSDHDKAIQRGEDDRSKTLPDAQRKMPDELGPSGFLPMRYEGGAFDNLRRDISYQPADAADTVKDSLIATAVGVFKIKDSVDHLADILKRTTGNPLAGDGDGAGGGGGSGGRPSIRYGHHGSALGGAMPNMRYGHGGTTPGSGQARDFGPKVSLGKMGGKFAAKAPVIMDGLMKKYGLTREQAAGVLGNLGHESAGFTAYHEGGQAPGRGGVGWAQWTGSRRKAFEKWTAAHGLNPTSDEASWRYLTEGDPETAKAILAVKRTNNRRDATRAFHDSFERSADIQNGRIVKQKSWNSRLNYADRAFASQPGGATVDKPLGTAQNPVVVKPDAKTSRTVPPEISGIAKSVNGIVRPQYNDARPNNMTSADNSTMQNTFHIHGAHNAMHVANTVVKHLERSTYTDERVNIA